MVVSLSSFPVSRLQCKLVSGPKRRPFIFASLVWKPFDSRFQDLLEQLSYHRQLLRDEMVLAEYHCAENARLAGELDKFEAAVERQRAAEARDVQDQTRQLTEEMKVLLEDQQKGKPLEFNQPGALIISCRQRKHITEYRNGCLHQNLLKVMRKLWKYARKAPRSGYSTPRILGTGLRLIQEKKVRAFYG